MPKGKLLYGWHRRVGRDRTVIVEGAWEVLRLHQIGVDAVAILGTQPSNEQLTLLRKTDCVVMLDGDHAGRAAARRIVASLGCPKIELPDGKDPADLDDRVLLELLGGVLLS